MCIYKFLKMCRKAKSWFTGDPMRVLWPRIFSNFTLNSLPPGSRHQPRFGFISILKVHKSENGKWSYFLKLLICSEN